MQRTRKRRVGKQIVQAKRTTTAMPVIIRDTPPGYDWGWYSREDPRMHLQVLNPKSKQESEYKVWLETRGRRDFVPVVKIPSKILKALQGDVAKYRQYVEDRWVGFMLDRRWIGLHVVFPQVVLTAYPNTPAKFTRKIKLLDWFTPEQVATLKPEIIALDPEMAALRLWADRSEGQVPYDVRLSSLLWTE